MFGGAAAAKRRSGYDKEGTRFRDLVRRRIAASAGLGHAMEIDAKSIRCITKMTPVRQFYVDNLQGNLDATLAAANSTTGAVYPPGSVIQLIPGKAMVKQDKGSRRNA